VSKKTLKLSSISEALGVRPTLPGESPEAYQNGLNQVITELGAETSLQIYLAEKIYDCLWWIRRYENQKREVVVSEMAKILADRPYGDISERERAIRSHVAAPQLSDELSSILEAKNHTLASLRQLAQSNKHKELRGLDDQIALQAKILAGFQASFEVATNRALNRERLSLQNDILRRDLDAIEAKK
jgi:hypothetical protein